MSRGLVALTVLLTGCGLGAPEPGSLRVREKADAAARTLSDFASTLDRAQVVSAWSADYCRAGIHNWKRDDPFDWDCYATQNVALAVGELRAGATKLHEQLGTAGCRPDPADHPSRHGLPVMLDRYDSPKPPHRYPSVRYLCGSDITLYVQPSDRSDARLGESLSRPRGWAYQSTGSAGNRLMAGGEISPDDVSRLTSTEGTLMLLTAVANYHRA